MHPCNHRLPTSFTDKWFFIPSDAAHVCMHMFVCVCVPWAACVHVREVGRLVLTYDHASHSMALSQSHVASSVRLRVLCWTEPPACAGVLWEGQSSCPS